MKARPFTGRKKTRNRPASIALEVIEAGRLFAFEVDLDLITLRHDGMEEMNPVLRNSFIDGIFSNVFATLTAGVFLTGLALYLGMGPVYIGLLGAMPYIVTIFQPLASLALEKSGLFKTAAIHSALAARFLWIFVLIAAVLPAAWAPGRAYFILLVIFLSSALVSVSYVSWLTWTAGLVPDAYRGRFFSLRNMFCGVGGLAATILFGLILQWSKTYGANGLALGFTAVLGAAVLAGLISVVYLRRIPAITPMPVLTVRGSLARPLREPNFRRFLLFSFCWNFSVYFAAPFFPMFFLRDLGFSYVQTSVICAVSVLADLVTMPFWGRLSDRIKNKPILQIMGWPAVLLPAVWATVRPQDFWFAFILQVFGGGLWAGINLCSSNLMIRLAPRECRSLYFSVTNLFIGVGAGLAPVFGGLLLGRLETDPPDFFGLAPVQLLFVASAMMRVFSLLLVYRVHESEAAPLGKLVRVLRGVRGMNTEGGLSGLLHPFLYFRKNNHRDDDEPPACL